MHNTIPYQHIILIGFGREGQSSFKYLSGHYPEATFLVFDEKNQEKLSENAQKIIKNSKKIYYFNKKNDFFDFFSENTDAKTTLVVKSPGVPPSHPVVSHLNQKYKSHVRFTSNVQLFFEHIDHHPQLAQTVKTIGVTGTKGKSTTTALIYHLLQCAKIPSLLGGNIGVPALDLIPRLEPNSWVVLELSSHQLADLTFSPHIAVIQNIVPEHLDYYPDFETYVTAKSHIVAYQKADDLIIYNTDFPQSTQLAQLSAGRHLCFTTASCKEAIGSIVPLSKLSLKGTHNLLNTMPSLLIARELGLSTKIVGQALTSFTPLPHRMELIGIIDGISYYNDSLSTTPEAAIAAIESFDSGSVILLAGGYERNLVYDQLAETILRRKVKAVLLFPTTGTRIEAAILDAANKVGVEKTTDASVPYHLPLIKHAATMQEAVHEARLIAREGDVVLLSPASASFSMYTDYVERGEAFRRAILV